MYKKSCEQGDYDLTDQILVPLSEILSRWREFFTMTGTAGATLVGLMFVAASIGAGVFTRAHQVGIRSFLSPTVVHFSAVMFASMISAIPTQTWSSFGTLVGLGGIAGIAYSILIWLRMARHGITPTIDIPDRLWYGLTPIAVYGVMVASGIALGFHHPVGLNLLAVALLLLLLIGIRNAWDMTIWIIDRKRE
jgi:hypothetical protein